MRAFATTAALAVLLALAAPAQGVPLFDHRPAEIDGVRYGAEKVYEGDYVANDEASVFQPMGRPKEMMWLLGWTDRPGDTAGASRTYHIRFIGRRTVTAGHYGHLGAYRHIVLITELIDARPKPPL